jgi:hypothetical protein
MKRAQEYIQCIPASDNAANLAKIHLAVIAWTALCRMKSLQHKIAYKNCFALRYDLGGTSAEVKDALRLQVKVAEQCIACQKNLYLVQKWQLRLEQRIEGNSLSIPQGYEAIRCVQESF